MSHPKPWLLVIAIGMLACSRDAPRDQRIDPTIPAAVVLTTPNGPARVTVDVAASPAAIEQGLMNRTALPAEHGMLFLMRREKDWAFWMQNTLIPLDIIFITKQRTIAGIIHRATPGSEERRRIGRPSLYVLEVNGGWARDHGLAVGAPVDFENLRL